MNKVLKPFITILVLLGMLIGSTVGPVANAIVTVNEPELDVGIKILKKDGSELSIPLSLSGDLVDLIGVGTSNQYGHSLISNTPLNVTKPNSLINEFSIKLPAYSKSISSPVNSSTSLNKVISNIKITPGVNAKHIKSFVTIGSNSFHRYEWAQTNSDPPTTNSSYKYNENTVFYFSKQADNSYLFNGAGSNFFNDGTTNHVYTTLGRIHALEGIGNNGATSSRAITRFGQQGDTHLYYANYHQVKEIFENTSGTLITPPTGYTQNKVSDVTSDPFTYTMSGDTSLPKSYVIGSDIYTYQGWYKGAGNQGTMSNTYPPSVSFGSEFDDSKDEVHIVYDVKAARYVTEQYIDESSAIVDPTWNGTVPVPTGSTFTQTPADPKTDSSGVDWEYLGWKLGTEPMTSMRPKSTPVSQVINANTTIQYVYRKKQHTLTEKIVDVTDGTTLIGVTPNPNTVSVDDNDPYTKTPTVTLTDTSGDDWNYEGWENVTDAPGTVNPATTPVSIANVKGAKEIKYHYRLAKTTATLDLTPTPQIVGSGGTVNWTSRLTNTGSTALKDLKLKATSNWASGLSHPTQVTVTPSGGPSVNFTIGAGDWTSGINLTGVNIPNAGPNNYADITFTDIATGAVNQVLPAEIEIDGNMASPLTAENFVRIDDPDEPNLEPLGTAGLINIPDFRFGEVEVKPYAQTKGLDSASYQSGYNPYIRFKDQESLSGWSLTTKLGQFTSGSKTLPATTTIQLKNGDLKEVQNYNKDNESLSSVSSIGTKPVPSDGTTVALTGGAAQGVYS